MKAEPHGRRRRRDKQVGFLIFLPKKPRSAGLLLKAVVLTRICFLKEIFSPPWTKSASGKKAGEAPCMAGVPLIPCREKNKKGTLEGVQGDFLQAPWHGSLQLPGDWTWAVTKSRVLSPGPQGTHPCSFRIPSGRPLLQGWQLGSEPPWPLHWGFSHRPASIFTLHVSAPYWRLKFSFSGIWCSPGLGRWVPEASCLFFFFPCGLRCPTSSSSKQILLDHTAKSSRRKSFKNTLAWAALSILMHSGSWRWLPGQLCQVWHSDI